MSDRWRPTGPLVVAHRGASRAFAENTLAAFRGAAALGADWVELDVRRTADGELVVHHDPALGGEGRTIASMTRDELPASVCSLADALAVCEHSAPPLGVNLEIKSERLEGGDEAVDARVCEAALSVIAATIARDIASSVLVTSFDLRVVDRVRVLDPTLPTGLLSAHLADAAAVVELAARHGHGALNPWDPFVDGALVERAHAAGLAVNVWTVDDPDRMRELVDLGVDGIITNVPDVARAVVDA